jgi:uncharacterized protein YkwD
MRHIRIPAAALLATFALALIPASAPASPRTSMLSQINAVRASMGIHPLRLSSALNGSSSRYAHRLMSRDYFGHASRIQASGRFRMLGEILEMHRGTRPQVGATLRAWLNSPPHRRVLLDRRFYWVGLGRAAGSFHGRRTTIWVGHFGHK